MALKLKSFPIPDPVRSNVIRNPPEGIPNIEDLEALQSDLKRMKAASLERVKKANHDLSIIKESYRRMKEKEKGKAKAIEPVKREREFTPLPDADSKYSSHSRARSSPHPLSQPNSRSSMSARDLEELKKKKKKRKRDFDDSDAETESQRPRKMTPPVTTSSNHSSFSKPPKSVPSISVSRPINAGPDFTIPPLQQPLIPARPPIPQPPGPGPSKATEVQEDFSKAKQPSNPVQIQTFQTSIEPYIRPIREEDIGFLEWHSDEVEPYIMPKLGRHYLEVWEEQDAGLTPFATQTMDALPESFAPPQPKWDPSTLSDPDLLTEDKGHGPLTERVISALLPIDEYEWKGVKAAEDAMEGRPGGSGAAASKKERLNVEDLEKRIRDNMRYHGLLTEIPDYSSKVDDPIATALRQLQSELRVVSATNRARKQRLADIARDRLAYQEYLELRDSIDKNITTTYAKLQKKDMPKVTKKKKTKDRDRGGEEDSPAPVPMPAALGLGPDEDNQLVVSQQLKDLVETRRRWEKDVGQIFRMKQEESPGRIWGLPESPVFEGIEEEVQALLGSQESIPAPVLNGKGKGKARQDVDMDVG